MAGRTAIRSVESSTRILRSKDDPPDKRSREVELVAVGVATVGCALLFVHDAAARRSLLPPRQILDSEPLNGSDLFASLGEEGKVDGDVRDDEEGNPLVLDGDLDEMFRIEPRGGVEASLLENLQPGDKVRLSVPGL